MEQLKNGLDRLYNGKSHLEYLLKNFSDRELSQEDRKSLADIDMFKKAFIESMEDDINTADAIACLFDLVKYANSNFDEKTPKLWYNIPMTI